MLHGTLIFTYMNDEQIHGKCEFCGFGIPYMESLWAINWGIHIKWLNMNPFLPFLESVPSWFCLVIPVRFFLNPWGGGNPSVLNVIFNPSSMNHPMATPGINLSNSQGLTVSRTGQTNHKAIRGQSKTNDDPYTHIWLIFKVKCRKTYTSPMDPMGIEGTKLDPPSISVSRPCCRWRKLADLPTCVSLFRTSKWYIIHPPKFNSECSPLKNGGKVGRHCIPTG